MSDDLTIRRDASHARALDIAKGVAGREIAVFEKILMPFAHPENTQRVARGGAAELDAMWVEVTVADWMRACAVLGHMDGDYARSLGADAAPSEAFCAELDTIAAAARTAAE